MTSGYRHPDVGKNVPTMVDGMLRPSSSRLGRRGPTHASIDTATSAADRSGPITRAACLTVCAVAACFVIASVGPSMTPIRTPTPDPVSVLAHSKTPMPSSNLHFTARSTRSVAIPREADDPVPSINQDTPCSALAKQASVRRSAALPDTDTFAVERPEGYRENLRLKENDSYRPWVTDLPRMPLAHSPEHASWTNSIAMCAIMKDEAVEDIREWVQYHKWLGFEHIYLTDNNSEDADEVFAKLRADFDPSFLTLRKEARPGGQIKVYAWCAEELRWRHNWITFFDLDEYLVLKNLDTSRPKEGLTEFLDKFKMHAGVAVHWIMFGPSGRETRPAGGGVLQHYDQCNASPSGQSKVIANSWFISGVTVHPHTMTFREQRSTVDESLIDMGLQWRPIHNNRTDRFWNAHASAVLCLEAERSGGTVDPDRCVKIPRHNNGHSTAHEVAIFHYATKSMQDFLVKMKRGGGASASSGGKNMSYYKRLERQQKHGPVCNMGKGLWDACCTAKSQPTTRRLLASSS